MIGPSSTKGSIMTRTVSPAKLLNGNIGGLADQPEDQLAMRLDVDRAAVTAGLLGRVRSPAARQGRRSRPGCRVVSIVRATQDIRSGLDVGALFEQVFEGLIGVKQHTVGQHSGVVVRQHVEG